MKEIINSIKKGWFDFLVLGTIFVSGIYFYLTSYYSLYRQKLSLIFTGFAYVCWGLVHHWRQEDLSLKIIFEYLFMALIGVSLAYFVLLSR